MSIDKHGLAVINLVGSSLDVLGALYLAYDLLGGKHGPLRTLTRTVTYGVLFGVGFGLALGPAFGLINGAAHGITLAWELSRAARRGPRPGAWHDVAMSAIRGCGYAIGASLLFGPRFGVTFGFLSALGQIVAYRVGVRPTLDYAPATRPRLTRHQVLAAVNRTVGYVIAGYVSSLVAERRDSAWSVGLEVGLVVGVVTAVVSAAMPLVEWTADHLPERRMGVLGIISILIGFSLQSVQYWLALFDLQVP